jgi:apolipoprotein N-acyltransferase
MANKEKLSDLLSYGLAILSGILLLLSFPPFNLGAFLAWFAVVPLLISVYNTRNVKKIGRLVLVTGLCISPLFLWIRWELDFFLPSIIAWLIGIVAAIAIGEFVLWYVKDYWKPRHLPQGGLAYLPDVTVLFLIPIMGTAVEFLAMNLPLIMKVGGAFGYFSISRTQWLNVPILQVASYTGMYGVTFLVLLVNCAVAYLIANYMDTRKISKQSLAILLIFAAIFALSWASIPSQTTGDITAVVIQAKPQVMETQHVNELYADLTYSAIKYEPDIVLWSFWVDYESAQAVGPTVSDYADFCKEHNLYLIGAGEIVCPDGQIEYCKYKYHFLNILDGLVPFDFKQIFPDMNGIETNVGKVGLLLCMESCSTTPAKKLVEDGTQFIAVTSADRSLIGTFPGLIGGNIVFLSAEYGVDTALYFESQGSIIVDSYGRILDDLAPEPEIVVGKISFANRQTVYETYGDIFGWMIVASAIVLLVYNFHLKEKSPFKYCENCRAKMKKDTEKCEECGESTKKPSLWKRILLHEYYEHFKK